MLKSKQKLVHLTFVDWPQNAIRVTQADWSELEHNPDILKFGQVIPYKDGEAYCLTTFANGKT